jgi:hypothetical protein
MPFLYRSSNHSKIQNSEVDLIPSSFNLAQQWVTVSRCNHGNKGMQFTVEQKGFKGIAGLNHKISIKDK